MYYIRSSLEVFQTLISYESQRERTFETSRKVNKFTRELATEIVKQKKLVLVDNHIYKYQQHTGDWIIINTEEKTCECARFFSKLVCKHLTAGCMEDQVRLEGLQVFPKRLKTLRRRRYLDIR